MTWYFIQNGIGKTAVVEYTEWELFRIKRPWIPDAIFHAPLAYQHNYRLNGVNIILNVWINAAGMCVNRLVKFIIVVTDQGANEKQSQIEIVCES